MELIPIKHGLAVHFRLKEALEPHETVPDCFEFQNFNELLYYKLGDAYPILRDALRNESATSEDIKAAIEQERCRADGISELSDEPDVAAFQEITGTSKRLAEHYCRTGKQNGSES